MCLWRPLTCHVWSATCLEIAADQQYHTYPHAPDLKRACPVVFTHADPHRACSVVYGNARFCKVWVNGLDHTSPN